MDGSAEVEKGFRFTYVTRHKAMRLRVMETLGLTSQDAFKTVAAATEYSDRSQEHYEDTVEKVIQSIQTYLRQNPKVTPSVAAKATRDWLRSQ